MWKMNWVQEQNEIVHQVSKNKNSHFKLIQIITEFFVRNYNKLGLPWFP